MDQRKLAVIGKRQWVLKYRQQVEPGDVLIYGVVLTTEHHKEFSLFTFPGGVEIAASDGEEREDRPCVVPVLAKVTEEILDAIIIAVQKQNDCNGADGV